MMCAMFLVLVFMSMTMQTVQAEVAPNSDVVITDKGEVKTKEEATKEKNTTVKKKIETVAGIELHSKYYPLANYRANVSTEGESWLSKPAVGAMNGITNFFFFLSKIISEMVDTCIDKLFSLDVVNAVADLIGKISTQLYNHLWASFGALFVVIAVSHLFFIFVFKQNAVETLKRGLILFLVMGLVTVWFSNVSYYLKVVNHWTEQTEGVLMKAGTTFTTDSEVTIPEGQELEGALSVMRNFYFDLTVERPYLLMNYGTPDKASIIKGDKNRVDRLLSLKSTDAGQDKRNEIIKQEINSKNNPNMSAGYVDYQMAIAFIAFLFTLILGIPLILIAFLHVLFSVLPMLLSIVLAITAILSILPSFSNSFLKTFGKMIALFLMKALVSLLILAIFLIVTLMDKLLPPTSPSMYFVNMLAIAITIICLLKYRNEVIALFTAGQVRVNAPMPHVSDLKDKVTKGFSSPKLESFTFPDLGGRSELRGEDSEGTETLDNAIGEIDTQSFEENNYSRQDQETLGEENSSVGQLESPEENQENSRNYTDFENVNDSDSLDETYTDMGSMSEEESRNVVDFDDFRQGKEELSNFERTPQPEPVNEDYFQSLEMMEPPAVDVENEGDDDEIHQVG
ncbi:CD3337/EF1877 family mobilome membrane protein [Listeria sp. ILCC796]|uniref:CD3337/EF1877 family mobilome membrane protein n=1 Tax=unclassified Listeria TaxID=2642072 RepID=UPI0035176C47